MKFCQRCGKEIMDEAIFCVHCGCSTGTNTYQYANQNDAPSMGMAFLGFFIPLAGLILWLVNKDTKPLMAQSAGKGALIGFITSTVLTIIYIIIVAVTMSSIMSSVMYY